MAVRSSI
jgi:hypothetical protein